jgi:hypothetical protein
MSGKPNPNWFGTQAVEQQQLAGQINTWRKAGRKFCRRAVRFYGEHDDADAILAASLSAVYYAAALDAAHFANLPEIVEDEPSELDGLRTPPSP